jgi:hypothetical protein
MGITTVDVSFISELHRSRFYHEPLFI